LYELLAIFSSVRTTGSWAREGVGRLKVMSRIRTIKIEECLIVGDMRSVYV
jgi:hypothetical protein